MIKKLFIMTGEPSGDQRAAEVVHALQTVAPNLEIRAVGGEALKALQIPIIFDIQKLAVMGLVEVIKNLPTIWQAYRCVKQELLSQKPEAILLVDYPGLNLKIARLAKSLGIRVIYYISPKLWAWKEKRVELIREYVDAMAVIFPFEVAFYQKHGIHAYYVGCPFVNRMDPAVKPRDDVLHAPALRLGKVLGLLPGSRVSEIKKLLPIMITVAERLKAAHPELRFVLPKAPGLPKSLLDFYLAKSKVPIEVTENSTLTTIAESDAVICASGTVSLEVGLLGVPQVVIYRLSWITGFLAKRVLKIPYVSLCNILMGRKIVPELLQDFLTREALEAETKSLLWDHARIAKMKKEYEALRKVLEAPESSVSLVELILQTDNTSHLA